MRIVDADLAELKRAQARTRARARKPETRALREAIESLKPGEAKAVMLEDGEEAANVRRKLVNQAKAVGIQLATAAQGDRVVFGLKKRGPGRPPNVALSES